MSLLRVKNIDFFYGKSHILFGLSLAVNEKEVVCLLGRNGVGKTSTLKAIIGIHPVFSGQIFFDDKEISRKPSYVISKLGIGYVPEDKRLFPSLTVRENLEIGAGRSARYMASATDWTLERVFELFPVLKTRSSYSGVQLSGGEQQMLAIGRALMTNPRLLLLDEPSQGLAPILQRNLGDLVSRIAGEGMTILMAEQSLTLALSLLDRAYVMEKGSIRYEGSSKQFRENSSIVKEYLSV